MASAEPRAEAALRCFGASTPPLRPEEEAPDEFMGMQRLVVLGVAAEVYIDAVAVCAGSSCVRGSFILALL